MSLNVAELTDAQLEVFLNAAKKEQLKRTNRIDWKQVHQFVYNSTKDFDNSHDYTHALAVARNARSIACSSEFQLSNIDLNILELCAVLHDVCDHKYPNSISKSTLYDFIYAIVHDGYDNYQEIAEFILRIIERVSFSKQKNNESKEAPSNHDEQVVLNIIRDSDRLEALGEVGVKRCEEFIRSRNGKLPEDFIVHSQEKLLRLLPDGYITTQKGKELAKPRHEYLVKYVNKLKETHLCHKHSF
jgi:uncharacterized protein